MEGSTELIESMSLSREQNGQTELGFHEPTFAPLNRSPGSLLLGDDDPVRLEQQQKRLLHEEFQCLDLKAKEVKDGTEKDEARHIDEVNAEKGLGNDDRSKIESDNSNGFNCGHFDQCDGLSDDRCVLDDSKKIDVEAEYHADDDYVKQNKIENEYQVDDDYHNDGQHLVDNAKKIEVEYDGWGDDQHLVEDAIKNQIEQDGWNGYHVNDDYERKSKYVNNIDGWSDDQHLIDESKIEIEHDGWNDYYHEDDGWKRVVNDDFGEEPLPLPLVTEEDDNSGNFDYPLRPGADDCSFYLRTGSCKYGLTCKFNHPMKNKRQNQNMMERMKPREDYSENSGQIECKYYLSPGGCKFGDACKFNHSGGTATLGAAAPGLNFVGLPIRPGEKECAFYMHTGSCKYGANCRFNHPDPTSQSDPLSGYDNGPPSWSPSRSLSETAPYIPKKFSSIQGISSHYSEWNEHQAGAYSPTAPRMNNSVAESNLYSPHQQYAPVEEFPERPGQPECTYFLKTGDCKYKATCKFHHPKDRSMNSAPYSVTDNGLPLRPDRTICSYFSRYGICKFGPNCRYDHPKRRMDSFSPTASEPDYNGKW